VGDANICDDLDDALERAKVVLAEREKSASGRDRLRTAPQR
jgi:hypothetical protein